MVRIVSGIVTLHPHRETLCHAPDVYRARVSALWPRGPVVARLLSTQGRSRTAVSREPRFDPALSLPGLPAHLFAPTRVHRALRSGQGTECGQRLTHALFIGRAHSRVPKLAPRSRGLAVDVKVGPRDSEHMFGLRYGTHKIDHPGIAQGQ